MTKNFHRVISSILLLTSTPSSANILLDTFFLYLLLDI
jgi:hypothetical protein